MNSAIFTTSFQNYHVSQILFAGPVIELPEEKRKGEMSHYFKIICHNGASYCHFKSQDAARNARNALGAMLNSMKPYCYKYGNSTIDSKGVVSFSNVFPLKTIRNDLTHAIVVTLDTTDEDNSKIWLKFKSEDNAWKGQKALFASIYAANDMKKEKEDDVGDGDAVMEPVLAEASSPNENLPF
ncbi:MAG: hypothetical protein GF401_17205 [Chitinivibrionales bacterium]|nr:hypothetical protein [Chitinivibrionales bacterium]